MLGGIILLAYNRPIASELTRLYFIPMQWIFGEKPWMIKVRKYFVIWMRFTLYGGSLIAFIIALLELAFLYQLF